MSESQPRAFFSWHTLSARTTAVLLQLLLWALLCGFYFAWYNRPNYHFGGPNWSLVLLRLLFAVGLFNALVYLIIPRWLLRGRYWLALAGAVGLVYAYGLFNFYGYQLANAFLDPTPRLAQYYRESYERGVLATVFSWQGLMEMVLELQANMLFPLVVSFLAYAQVVDRRRLALERDQLNLELRYLKTQINPQFLFHTLGSLHHFTQQHDPRAGDMVLHLADLMRYTLYESDTETVLLSRELEFLEDYLALERLRAPEASRITHTTTGQATTQRLVPLTLYPLLEGLFLGLEAGQTVSITNTVEVLPQAVSVVFTRATTQPVLANYATSSAVAAALRRLQLHYPGRHEVQVTEQETTLRVQLYIQL